MVKFQVRWMKKRYQKKKEYRYKHYSLDFPVRLNEKIEFEFNRKMLTQDILETTKISRLSWGTFEKEKKEGSCG